MTEGPILVTGAAGFIGFHVARRLLRDGHDVIGLDNMNPYYDPGLKEARRAELAKSNRLRFVKLDLADRDGMANLFKEFRFPHVIHLGAQAGVRYSLIDPFAYVDANLTGFTTILEGCRHNNCRHLLYASSSSVYGSNTKMPFSVHDNVDHPLSLIRRVEEGERADVACVRAFVRTADDRIALFHSVRAVGPSRHGDVDFREGNFRWRTHQTFQQWQYAARFHLR